jgi:hypothetical protein
MFIVRCVIWFAFAYLSTLLVRIGQCVCLRLLFVAAFLQIRCYYHGIRRREILSQMEDYFSEKQ